MLGYDPCIYFAVDLAAKLSNQPFKEYNKTVNIILKAGADPNLQNEKGFTPLPI